MIPFKIGNWLITDESIDWKGQPDNDYYIQIDRLLELDFGDDKIFHWLTHMAEKTWLTREDIYALNTAFIYAIEYFKIKYDTGSFIETLKYQQLILKDKEQ